MKIKILALILLFSQLNRPAFAENPPDFNRLVDAIYRAEGGAKAKKPFGILSVPCSGYSDCRKVALNTVRNNWKRWEAGTHGAAKHRTYLDFLGSRYCPVGAGNDNGTNRFWVRNVSAIYGQLNQGGK